MKRYEDNNFSSSPPRSFKKPKHLTPKQELKRRCEEMISNANKTINPVKSVTELSCASSKDSFKTASDSVCNDFDDELAADDVFMNEDNLLKLENDICKYERTAKAQSSEFSDIIGETEETTPLPKKRKTTASENTSTSKDTRTKNVFFENLDLEICTALKEADADKSVGTSESPTNLHKEKKINILADVKIKSQDRKEDVKVDEDDLFSDEDIVETTPQKKIVDR